jgi:putative ABC transport system permease protein
MTFWASILVGVREVLAHKFRSLLTLFGIILGVASLIATHASVEGLTRGMRSALILFGGLEKISLIDNDVPAEQEDLKDLSPGKTMDDVQAILDNCHLITEICPVIDLGGTAVEYGGYQARPKVAGTSPSFASVNNYELKLGRDIADLDLSRQSRVCVIGEFVWLQLSAEGTSPIGKFLKINNIPFEIVGMYRFIESDEDRSERLRREKESGGPKKRKLGRARPRGGSEWKSNIVLIPLTTGQVIFRSASLDLGNGLKGPDYRLNSIDMQVASANQLQEAVNQVQDTVLKIHRGIEDFRVRTNEEWANGIERQIRAARLNGGIISVISLIVGGIGITNIMLASITERIREIGVRMAVGAHRKHVFSQILIESSILGFLGGLLGIAASLGLIHGIRQFVELAYEPVLTFNSVITSFGFSVLTGIFAGIFPGLKAARLDPIQALRYE